MWRRVEAGKYENTMTNITHSEMFYRNWDNGSFGSTFVTVSYAKELHNNQPVPFASQGAFMATGSLREVNGTSTAENYSSSFVSYLFQHRRRIHLSDRISAAEPITVISILYATREGLCSV